MPAQSKTRHSITGAILLVSAVLFLVSVSEANDLNLYVQPIASVAETKRAFKPLADYLSEQTGFNIKIQTEPNFLSYWQRMRRGDKFHLVLDAAHFTDYRVKTQGYTVLVKLPDTVSFSLVTNENLLLFDADELIGKSLASAPSPSLGGVRIAELFSNPLRQPHIVPAQNFRHALDMVKSGKTHAALVPTPLVNGDSSINTIMTTAPVPHMAISASKNLPAATQTVIKNALLEANRNDSGRKMLQKLNYQRFVAAENEMYQGYSSLLQGMWGVESDVAQY